MAYYFFLRRKIPQRIYDAMPRIGIAIIVTIAGFELAPFVLYYFSRYSNLGMDIWQKCADLFSYLRFLR